MKIFFVFLSGLISGFFITLIILYLLSLRPSNSEEAQIQFIEIKGRKGYVKLSTDMVKDSVLVLIGKPDEVRLKKIGNTIMEYWGYKLKNMYVTDLDIDFQDGKLTGVRQN